MGASCTLKPTIIKDGKEIESPLYKNLYEYTQDTELSKAVYTMTKAEEARKIFKITMGNNNEADFNSVVSNMHLYNVMSPEIAVQRLEEENRFSFTDAGEKVSTVFNNSNEAFEEAKKFNKEYPKFVAKVLTNNTGTSISIEPKTEANKFLDNLQKQKQALNNHLIGILHRLGFDIDREVPATDYSTFNAVNAEKNADNLLKVIHIVKGKQGEEDLPEEFAHFIIEGLQNTDNVQRLLSQLNPEVVQAVLGEDYSKYATLYNNDTELLKKEVAGKLLMNALLAKHVHNSYMDNQVLRVWNYAKNKLKLTNEDEITKLVDSIILPVNEIVDSIDSKELDNIFSKQDVINSKVVLRSIKELNKAKDLLEKELDFLHKKYKRYEAALMKTTEKAEATAKLDTIKSIQKSLDNAQYSLGVLSFIGQANTEFETLFSQLTIIDQNINEPHGPLNNLNLIHQEVAQCKEVIRGYERELHSLTSLVDADAKVVFGDSYKDIKTQASVAKGQIDGLKTLVSKLQYVSLKMFMKKVFLTVPTYSNMKDNELEFLIQKLLELGTRDLGFIDRFFMSPQLSSNLLFNFFSLVTDQAMSARDLRFTKAKHTIEALRTKVDSDEFMYERDENGIPTGYFKSKYNFSLWRKDLHETWEKLSKDTSLSKQQRSQKYNQWKADNTQEVVVDQFTGRTESYPKGDRYMLADPKDTMTQEQVEYYDAILDLKSEYESELPPSFGKRFKAPQIENDTIGLIEEKRLNMSTMTSLLKDQFVKRNYDTFEGDTNDYYEEPGDLESEKAIHIVTDLAGAQIKRVPTYFTKNIDDLSRLSTDCASSIKAYVAMIINHTELTKASDSLSLLQDHIENVDYEVKQHITPLQEISKFGNDVYTRAHYEKGDTTKLSKAIKDYMDGVYYGDKYLTKTKNGTSSTIVRLGSKTVTDENGVERVVPVEMDLRKPVKLIQSVTSLTALGLSVFAATGNIIDGINKKIVAAAGAILTNKESINYKDMAIAQAKFWKGFTEYGAINSFRMTTHGYNTLVNEMFDTSGDTYERALHDKYRKNTFNRLLGNSSFSFMMTLGDTYMRSTSTLSILNHEQVIDAETNNSIPLYDAFEVVYTGKNGDEENMFFKKGTLLSNDNKTTFEAFTSKDYVRMRELTRQNAKHHFDELSKEATELSLLHDKDNKTNQYISRIRMKVTRVNNSMLGSFSEVEKNRLSRSLLGSFLMQFRRWMPEIYADRFAAGKHVVVETDKKTGEMKLVEKHGNMNLQTGQIKEGMYITLGRYLKYAITPKKLYKDIIGTQSKLKYLQGIMTAQEKQNIIKSITEFGLISLLTVLLKILGPVKDHKGSWAARYLAYTMMRSRMELRSECPLAFGFIISSNMQLLKNPIPGVKTLDDVLTMLRFQDMFDTVQSGRYKGKSVWVKHFRQKFPLWRQMENLLNIDTDNTMFMQFKNQGTIRADEDKSNSNMYDKSNNKIFTGDNKLLKDM